MFEERRIKDVMQEASEKAFRDMVEAIASEMFRKRWGYEDNKDVAAALKDEVRAMIQGDEDIRARIKARLLSIIDGGQGDT